MTDKPLPTPGSSINANSIDTLRLPPRTVFGIGRNYAAHARELGNPVPMEPVVFLKPASALLENGGTILLPWQSAEVQHELELVLLLGTGGRHLSIGQAWRSIAGYGIGIDVTARDLQRRAQAAGNPWTIAKGFDTFAPISRFASPENIADPNAIQFDLTVNGTLRQSGNSGDMLFDCGNIVAYLSTIFTLQAGDLIFTGSPEGVATIRPEDRLVARLVDTGITLEVDAAPARRA